MSTEKKYGHISLKEFTDELTIDQLKKLVEITQSKLSRIEKEGYETLLMLSTHVSVVAYSRPEQMAEMVEKAKELISKVAAEETNLLRAGFSVGIDTIKVHKREVESYLSYESALW